MKLQDNEYELLYKKLEYTFKKSGNPLVDKIKDKQDLSEDDIRLLLKKLEYTFRKSGNEIISKLSKLINIENYSPVNYSNIKAKIKKEIRDKEKEDSKELKHLKKFNEL